MNRCWRSLLRFRVFCSLSLWSFFLRHSLTIEFFLCWDCVLIFSINPSPLFQEKSCCWWCSIAASYSSKSAQPRPRRKSKNDFRTAMFERKKSPNWLVVDEAIKRIWVCVSSFPFPFFVTAVSISFHIWHRRMALFWFKLVNEVDRCIETSLEIEMRNCVIW